MSNAKTAFRLLQWCADRAQCPELDEVITASNGSVRSFLKTRDIDSILTLASEGTDAWQVAYDAVWRQQLTTLHQVIEAFASAGVRTLTFKGGELLPRHYPGHSIGFVTDADLLVRREHIEAAKSIMYSLGFRHAFFDPAEGIMRDRDIRNVAEIEMSHYELAPFVKVVEIADPIVVEV